MTNTYCVYTVLRYSWWWTVDLSETFRVLYQINLRNNASSCLSLWEWEAVESCDSREGRMWPERRIVHWDCSVVSQRFCCSLSEVVNREWMDLSKRMLDYIVFSWHKYWFGNSAVFHHLGNLGVGGRVVLKWMLSGIYRVSKIHIHFNWIIYT